MTGVQTCALPICTGNHFRPRRICMDCLGRSLRTNGFFKGIELESFQYCSRVIGSNRLFNDGYFASTARYSRRHFGKSAAYAVGIHNPQLLKKKLVLSVNFESLQSD